MELRIERAGTKLFKKGGCLGIKNDITTHLVAPEKIDNILLDGEASITKGAILLSIENDIPIIICNENGKPLGRFWKIKEDRFGKLRKIQYDTFNSLSGLELGRSWILEKIENQKNQLTVLIENRNRTDMYDICQTLERYIVKIKESNLTQPDIKNLIMGYEGIASRYYFSAINEFLDPRWRFKNREHQNAKTPYNIILNYLYGFLYNIIEKEILLNGFDPYVGIIHAEDSYKMPLVYDLIEKYRYIALDCCFQLFNQKIISNKFFEIVNDRYILSSEGKREIAEFYYKRLNKEQLYNGKKYKLLDTIKLYIEELRITILRQGGLI